MRMMKQCDILLVRRSRTDDDKRAADRGEVQSDGAPIRCYIRADPRREVGG